ncbi:TaqI-like C-terminal specificity domain-containing protein [Butyrivibrio sp. LC3010]|uniref:TaqI-like C-terminal specificity domain-containing protein n=1 Tax=Butyrivibrio sp. LC3010 TaxID=1280680 RepID=UPI000404107D|nr:TaqI-like C-terminal specificity domain-containing protein [Butyrivibrio sp. LC3010]
MLTLTELCTALSISTATGRNWIKLGKLKPEGKKGRSYVFSESYLKALKDDLNSGKIKSLKSRRNKSFVSGNLLYSDYITEGSPNLPLIETIINAVSATEDEADAAFVLPLILDDNLIRCILERSAAGILKKRVPADEIYKYDPLLSDLSGASCDELSPEASGKLSELSDTFLSFSYVSGEDTLGLIYISLRHLQSRKSTGAYYTPGAIVQRLLGHLFEASFLTDGQNKKILDPGCGSGNFLLCLPPGVPAENLYGYDIDEISVQIARLTLAFKYRLPDITFWKKHIVKSDFLHADRSTQSFDVILGNPPWGASFSLEEKNFISEKFICGREKSVDSFDLFIEQGLNLLEEGGMLSYVLPESVLLVKSHTPARKELVERSSLSHLEYLGDVFNHVQCPSIILQVEKKSNAEVGFLSSNPTIYDNEITYNIMTEREISTYSFNFLMPDEEYALLQSISTLPGARTLQGNAEFALGIVTGANKEMLQSRKSPKNEIILKGTDIFKYAFHVPKCYINFVPEKCQQVAPIELYRAPQKLLYRFIGGRLVFAYDDNKTLSLNSCNIVIPNIDGLDIKYILAVLNSSVADYFFRKKFRSVKVLRSHIEQIPIPYADDNIQRDIVSKIDRIIRLNNQYSEVKVSERISCSNEIKKLHSDIDNICFKLYNLSNKNIHLIKQTISDENLFLPI